MPFFNSRTITESTDMQFTTINTLNDPAPLPCPLPPPTTLSPPTPHEAYEQIREEQETYFLRHWPEFVGNLGDDEKEARRKFVKGDYALWTAYAFGSSQEKRRKKGGESRGKRKDQECKKVRNGEVERMRIASEAVTLDFLVDDYLDTIEEAEANELIEELETTLNECIEKCKSGFNDVQAVPSYDFSLIMGTNICTRNWTSTATATRLERAHASIINMHADLWTRMLQHKLSADVAEAHVKLIRFQVSKKRENCEMMRMQEYNQFRHIEGGIEFIEKIHYFVLEAELVAQMRKDDFGSKEGSEEAKTVMELKRAMEILRECEYMAGKHIVWVNDIISLKREEEAQRNIERETGRKVPMVSCLPIVSRDFAVDTEGGGEIMWTASRALERCFKEKVQQCLALLDEIEGMIEKKSAEGENERELGAQVDLVWEARSVLGGLEARMAGGEAWSLGKSGRYEV